MTFSHVKKLQCVGVVLSVKPKKDELIKTKNCEIYFNEILIRQPLIPHSLNYMYDTPGALSFTLNLAHALRR